MSKWLLPILVIYTAANMYLMLKGGKFIIRHAPDNVRQWVSLLFWILYPLIAILPVVGAVYHSMPFRGVFQQASNLWLGFMIYQIIFLLLLDIFRKVCQKTSFSQNLNLPVVRITAAIIVLVASTGILVYGSYHATRQKVTDYNLVFHAPIQKETSLVVAFAADFHLGYQTRSQEVEKTVKNINEMKPDLVLFGGDMFDSDFDAVENPKDLIDSFKSIRSKYGVYGVYGNHDVTETLIGGFAVSSKHHAFRDPRMEQFLLDSGITMLEDQVVTIANGTITLAGRLDGEKSGEGITKRKTPKELLTGVSSKAPLLVLEHEPNEMKELEQLGADLVLSGHTHDGQFFPLNLAQRILWSNSCGQQTLGKLTSLVTSGVGVYGPPIRVGTDNEVMKITILIKPE